MLKTTVCRIIGGPGVRLAITPKGGVSTGFRLGDSLNAGG